MRETDMRAETLWIIGGSAAASARQWAGRVDVQPICPNFTDAPTIPTRDINMPAILPPEITARAIIHGLNPRRFEVHFSAPPDLWLKLLSALIYWTSLPFTRRLVP